MTRLYNRQYKLTVASPTTPTTFFGVRANAIVISELRVTFKIEKTSGKEPNKCEIKIFNLAERTRSFVEHKPVIVRLDAGYDGELSRVYQGDLTHSISGRSDSPVGWMTSIECADGARSIQSATLSKSFGPGTTRRAVARELAEAMGIAFPTGHLDLDGQFASGYVTHGRASEHLSRVLTPAGYQWSIQDSRLQIQKTTDKRGSAILISSNPLTQTGLIGSPSLGAAPSKTKAQITKFKCYLYPDLSPGGLIKLDARDVRGLYKIDKVVHTGDTGGKDWYSDVEAVPYSS